jgi:A/G-specific adenine glycosylase
MDATAARLLLDHHRVRARDLPWRMTPRDPYRTWLSEVMLQQTTVATVTPRFLRFVERWPTVGALAAASDEEILGEWAERGGFPRTETELRRLPGLGAYTAAAVAGIAFGEDAAAVDTNVERVAARVFGIADRRAAGEAARGWFPAGRHGEFAEALMDLGSAICRPKAPNCPSCPIAAHCRARALGTPETFPAPKLRKERPHRFAIAWWVRRGDELWLVRRPGRGLLGGMAALPGPEWSDMRPTANAIAVHRHGFTHFTLDLLVVPCAEPPPGDGWWQNVAELGAAGLPTLYLRAAEAALNSEREPRLAA